MYDPGYIEQVRLLLQCMPIVAECDCFALKGGSAINLFLRDMPRVSVDIDLTYLPLEARDTSITGIETALKHIKSRIEGELDDIVVNTSTIQGHIVKLTVMYKLAPRVRLKSELSSILPWLSAFPPQDGAHARLSYTQPCILPHRSRI